MARALETALLEKLANSPQRPTQNLIGGQVSSAGGLSFVTPRRSYVMDGRSPAPTCHAQILMTEAERNSTIQELGYDEREARFLSAAALHSGYFLRRQFETFAHLKRGRASCDFQRKTVKAGHTSVNVYANRTEVYHLFARALYRAIGEEDNRNRRARPPLSIKAKLMALDYVLAHRSRNYLATEQDKFDYFTFTLGIDAS